MGSLSFSQVENDGSMGHLLFGTLYILSCPVVSFLKMTLYQYSIEKFPKGKAHTAVLDALICSLL